MVQFLLNTVSLVVAIAHPRTLRIEVVGVLAAFPCASHAELFLLARIALVDCLMVTTRSAGEKKEHKRRRTTKERRPGE